MGINKPIKNKLSFFGMYLLYSLFVTYPHEFLRIFKERIKAICAFPSVIVLKQIALFSGIVPANLLQLFIFNNITFGRVALTELKVFFNHLGIWKKTFCAIFVSTGSSKLHFSVHKYIPIFFRWSNQIKRLSKNYRSYIGHAVIYLMLVAQSSAKAIQLWVKTQRNILLVERSILTGLNHKFEREYRHIIMVSS